MALNFNDEMVATLGRDVTPAPGFKKSVKPTVNIAKFGDGYAQRVVSGLNNMPGSWPLSFVNQDLTVCAAIVNFLKARNGVEVFTWTPPGESTPVKVVCTDGWEEEYVAPFAKTITCTWTEVFDPI